MATGINFHIGADNRKFVQVVRQTNGFLSRQTSQMRTRMIAVGAAFGTFIGGAALKAFGTAARAASNSARGIKEAFDLGGTLSELSAQTGIAVRDLYILQKAFEDSGISADSVGKVINKMQRTLAQAADGDAGPAEALAKLGLAASDFEGLSPAKQFALLQQRISALPSATLRAAVAMDIFGRSGGQLLTLFSSSGAMAEAEAVFGEQADLLQENAAKFDEVSDRLNRAGAKFKGLYLGMAAVFVDKVLPILDRIEGANFVEKGQALGQMIANAVKMGMEAWDTAGRVMDHLRGIFATAIGLAAYIVNPLWDGISRAIDLLKAGFWQTASVVGGMVATLLEMPISLALDLQSGFEFAFQKAIEFFDGSVRPVINFLQAGVEFGLQKAIEFFDGKLRGVINFLQAGVEWAIQQGFAGISKIPGLNKLLGLEGFKAQTFDEIVKGSNENNPGSGFKAQGFDEIAKRNAENNPSRGFKAQSYQEIRDRNFANSDIMQSGMQIVGDVRAASAQAAENAAKSWQDAFAPKADIMDPQVWFDTAAEFKAKAQQPPDSAPTLPTVAAKPDPWAAFRGFKTFTEPGALGDTGGLTSAGLSSGGLAGKAHGLVRRGDAARRAAAEREKDKNKTPEGTNERLDETNDILREALL